MRTSTRLASLLMLLFFAGCGQPVGYVLEYAPVTKAEQKPPNLEELAALVENRVNARGTVASVQVVDGKRIEIQVYGSDPAVVARVERLMQMTGRMELRIVADYGIPKQSMVISRGKQLDVAEIRDRDGKLRGWWVPIAKNQGEIKWKPEKYDEAETQGPNWRRNEGGEVEVVVLKGDYDVTGEHLARAYLTEGVSGEPVVGFTLTKDGSVQMGRLTQKNLPDSSSGRPHHLAIILNGKIHAAPAIQARITGQGILSGDFTQPQIEELADMLNGGAFPVRLKQVRKEKVGPD